jgi:metal-responsive CopG/Arc/MetJ family transcriptional regulator
MERGIEKTASKNFKSSMKSRSQKAKGRSRSAVVSDALKKYLALREIAELRQKMIPKARAQGIYSDEDVFALVS